MPSGQRFDIYTDGACQGNPGRGGWAAVLTGPAGKQVLSGGEEHTTNNRMELLGAINGLEATPEGSQVSIHSDSTYLVNTMTRSWKRNANLDLWKRLDGLCASRRVDWQWVKGHSGDQGNEEADAWAGWEAGVKEARPMTDEVPQGSHAPSLSHLDERGQATMVDVGWKPDTEREAVAHGSVLLQPETLRLIREGQVKKGDVLATARLAGIMGAKQTPHLIPLCHPLPLTHISVDLELDDKESRIRITATAKTRAKTGVEMEALTAVSVAALTLYDMCKSADRSMRIHDIRLVEKRGGKSGDMVLES